jgi:hypothetical protein
MTGDPVREEAERLVAAALAAAQRALAGGAGERFATGSTECCICPVCRAIAAVRNPSPEFAERLATGAGDLAAGVASLLRSFAGTPRPPEPRSAPDDEQSAGTGTPEEDVWAAATHGGLDDAASGGEPQR